MREKLGLIDSEEESGVDGLRDWLLGERHADVPRANLWCPDSVRVPEHLALDGVAAGLAAGFPRAPILSLQGFGRQRSGSLPGPLRTLPASREIRAKPIYLL
jgi:hypothetical protein